jgi:hypothetical protein
MQHLMFQPEQGAAPGLWGPGWVQLDDESYPASAVSEGLLRDMTEWVMVYERAYLAGGDRALDSLGSEWHSEGYLLVARVNAELMPRGFAVWPAFEGTTEGLVTRKMGDDFREQRLSVTDAQIERLVESSNELLAAHHLPLIPVAEPDAPAPTDS